MAKNFFQPVRMESQFVATKLITAIYQAVPEEGSDAAPAACVDGQLVVLGDFAVDPIYKAAYTAAGNTTFAAIDFNTRTCKLPSAATDTGICVIDLANVPEAVGGAGAYRMGTSIIGLTAEAGHWVRVRKLVVDDVFATGEENCTGALTVGQYAIVSTTGKWAPSATAPTGGTYAKVINKYVISQGVDGSLTGAGVQAYMLCIMSTNGPAPAAGN